MKSTFPAADFLTKPIDILGLEFHPYTLQQAADRLEYFIQKRDRTYRVTFANAYTMTLSWDNPRLREVMNTSDLVCADGMSIVWGARWLGIRLPQRVAGPDLTEEMCARAAQKGYRLFLLGSTEANVARMQYVLEQRWPGLQIAGTHSPSMSPSFSAEESADIRRRIEEAAPDILLIGISAPKQELWLAENQSRLQVPVAMAIGAAFDFLSGKIPRAPQRIQRAGLEWLYRLGCEPMRLWKRYLLGNAVFLAHLSKQALRRRWRL